MIAGDENLGGKYLGAAIAGDYSALDLRIINLESAVIKNGTPINKSGAILPMWPENLSFIKEANIDCAVLANNHVGDFGDKGVLSTFKGYDTKNLINNELPVSRRNETQNN